MPTEHANATTRGDPFARSMDADALEAHISRVGETLRENIELLLAGAGGPANRPADVCRHLGINKDLASKLLIAISKRDPLAVAYYMPGPEALRKLLSAVRRASPDMLAATLESFKQTVDEFDSLLRSEAGGRASFDALVSSWLPEARQRFEAASRLAAYRGMSGIRGVSAELNTLVYFLHPSVGNDDPNDMRIDVVTIDGYVHLKRLRAGAPIHASSGRFGPPGSTQEVLTLDGEPVDALSANTLLAPFCSQPTPRLEIQHVGNIVHTLVAGDLVGLASAVDLYFGEHNPRFMKQYADPPDHLYSLSSVNEIPSEVLVLDVLLHRDVWPDSEPELVVHDTSVRGVARPNDRSRDIDRLETSDTIQFLGKGVASSRISEAPRHVDLLRHVCNRMSWDGDAFRCYRLRSAYPIYGSQVHMMFDRTRPG